MKQESFAFQAREVQQKLLEIQPIEESPTFALFALKNGVMLGLWSKHTAEPTVHSQAGSMEICFSTADVDLLFEEWQNYELSVLQMPTDMDFGRTFVVADPDGHRIRIYKLLERHGHK